MSDQPQFSPQRYNQSGYSPQSLSKQPNQYVIQQQPVFMTQAPQQILVPVHQQQVLMTPIIQQVIVPPQQLTPVRVQQISPRKTESLPNENLYLNQRENKANTLSQNICVLLLPLISAMIYFFVSFDSMYHSYAPEDKLLNSDKVLLHVFNNLQANPINSIQQKAQTGCPSGYQLANVGAWEGTQSGCLCPDGQILNWFSCIFKPSCKYAGARDQKVAQLWEQNLQYCVQYQTDWSRIHTCTQANNVRCATDICSPTTSRCGDTIIERLVNAQGQPVTITPQQQTQFQTSFPGQTFQEINTDNTDQTQNYWFYFDPNQVTNQRPFVGFQISTSPSLCYNPLNSPQTDSQKQYALQKQQYAGCDVYGQFDTSLIVQLSSMNMQAFFQLNGIDSKVADLPFWNEYKTASVNDKIFLLAEKKIEVQSSSTVCQQLDEADFQIAANYSSYTGKVLRFFVIGIFIFACLVIILCVYFVAILNSNQSDEQKLSIAKYYIISSVVMVVFAIIMSSFYYVSIKSKLTTTGEHLKNYALAECFGSDQQHGINLAIKNINIFYDSEIKYFDKANVIYLVFAIIYLLIWVLLWISFRGRVNQRV